MTEHMRADFIIFVQIFLSLIMAIGTIGNSLTIIAIITCKKHRTTQNVYMGGLAISDLLVCMTLPPYTIWQLSVDRASHMIMLTHDDNDVICKMLGMLFIGALMSSIHHLSAVAINRYILIMKPAHVYMKLYTKQRVIGSICLIWVVSLASLLPGILGFGSFGYNVYLGACVVTDEPMSKIMAMTILFVPTFCVCFSVMIFAYIRIMLYFRSVSRGLHMHRGAPSVTVDTTERVSDLQQGGAASASSKRIKKEMFVIVKLCTIFAVFVVCWAPVSLVFFLNDLALAAPIWLQRLFFCIAISSSGINVFIYAGMSKSIRQPYREILLCKWKSSNH